MADIQLTLSADAHAQVLLFRNAGNYSGADQAILTDLNGQ